MGVSEIYRGLLGLSDEGLIGRLEQESEVRLLKKGQLLSREGGPPANPPFSLRAPRRGAPRPGPAAVPDFPGPERGDILKLLLRIYYKICIMSISGYPAFHCSGHHVRRRLPPERS